MMPRKPRQYSKNQQITGRHSNLNHALHGDFYLGTVGDMGVVDERLNHHQANDRRKVCAKIFTTKVTSWNYQCSVS